TSDNPPWPSAILWISSGPRQLVNETLTCATCGCADALSAKANARLSNNQSLGSGMGGDIALTVRLFLSCGRRRRFGNPPANKTSAPTKDVRLPPRRSAQTERRFA